MKSIEKIPSPASSNERLHEFQKEIAGLKKAEEGENIEERKTAHFEGLDPRELTEEDMEAWEKYKNKTLTPEEFLLYRDEAIASKNKSRHNFMAFLANKLTPLWMEKDLPSGF